jgi:hypothetical protein
LLASKLDSSLKQLGGIILMERKDERSF